MEVWVSIMKKHLELDSIFHPHLDHTQSHASKIIQGA
jgi:hypothetical protein